MIGDWLQHASGKCFQITRLDMWVDGSVHFACGHPHLWEYNNKFTPIPLSAEILEKNGFDISDKEVMQYHFEEDGEKYHFSLRQMYDKDGKPHGYSFYAFNVLTLLDYVHELQHALRLCGIEKKIKL